MPRISIIATTALALLASISAGFADGELNGTVEAVISVADQRMALLCNGGLVVKFPISTSRFGTGDGLGSYRTPVGRLKVCDKIGGDLPPGAVIKHRSATGEVLPVNAPGRDPIVSRIMWLEGLEEQNRNAKARSIYIHGTTEENKLGKNVSWGCIRMRTTDVIELYETLPVGAAVTIVPEHLPHYSKYTPPPPPPPAAPAQPALIAGHPAAAGAKGATTGAAKPGAAGPSVPVVTVSTPTHLVISSSRPVRPLPEPIAALATPYDEQSPHFSNNNSSGNKGANLLKGSILNSGLEESIAALRSSGSVPPPLPGKASAGKKSAPREVASQAAPTPRPAGASPSASTTTTHKPAADDGSTSWNSEGLAFHLPGDAPAAKE